MLMRLIKEIYKYGLNLGLKISRKLIFGYYPVFLEYPIKPAPRYGYGNPPHPELYNLINKHRERYKETLLSFLQFEDNFRRIVVTNPEKAEEPCWINRWLPAFDSVAVYGMISLYKPRLYMEVGSGLSTRFAKRAIRDQELATRIMSIDPQPRAEINAICDTIIRKPLEEVDITIFDELQSGDILYIDGSHYCFQNSDVTVIFLDVMPRLKPGVIVEFHDIFLPYDYHPTWKERYYSEQYLLGVGLLASEDRFSILLPNAFISEDPELKHILDPVWDNPKLRGVERHGGSFWLRINK